VKIQSNHLQRRVHERKRRKEELELHTRKKMKINAAAIQFVFEKTLFMNVYFFLLGKNPQTSDFSPRCAQFKIRS